MTVKSDKFELQISKLHELLEQPDAEVTWNDHLPDPDNPTQPRQIDITIKRENKLTLVECRIHKKKQNVKWVEELIGRRISLKADAIIAVSASGFTKGAILKAKSHGIILRDILTLTEEEITNWGRQTTIKITLFQYNNVCMTFVFPKIFASKVSVDDVEKYLIEHGSQFRGIFESIASWIDDNNKKYLPGTIIVSLSIKELRVKDLPIKKLQFQSDFEAIVQQLETPSVVAYDSPETDALTRNVFIEQVELGEFEIMQSSNEVSVSLDLSPVSMPNNCQFYTVGFDFQRKVRMQSIYILALPEMGISLTNVCLSVKFE